MENMINDLARIAQIVAACDDPLDQVSLIVESISDIMNIDVCSLYLAAPGGEMKLQASHGLAAEAVRTATLPAGAGLVGRVVASRHPINVADAESHPDYYYLAQTAEDSFHSFCGVPLVNSGTVIGVLVAQCRVSRVLLQEEESFLVTLAAHLALVLAANPLVTTDQAMYSGRYPGVKGAPGVGIGIVRMSSQADLNSVPDTPCKDVDDEVAQWRKLRTTVSRQIEQEQQALERELHESVVDIFGAYQKLLEDPAFTGFVEQNIRGGNWLPGALRKATKHFSELFRSMEDPYLRARHEDIQYLGNKLFNAWRGAETVEVVAGQSIVLMGHQVSVSEIAAIPVEQLAGVVCFEGSGLSHTAVLANALGVPAVMGTGVIRCQGSKTLAIVDGSNGQVLLNPSKALRTEYRALVADRNSLIERLKEIRELPAVTVDGIRMNLYVNTGLLADISPGLLNGAEGVGLYRTEIPFLIHGGFPSEEEQIEVYQQVLQSYAGKPVHMRTLDVGGDKQLPYFPIERESNPALGWRGIRFTLDNTALMMTQLRAMLRAARDTKNLRILFPMISSSAEIDAVIELLADAVAQLQAEGYAVVKPDIGVMIEVPAAISQIHFWRKQIDFVSIGSNDLSQYLLALDRDNPRVASRYDHVHPAVLLEIARIVKECARWEIPVSLCGEMASDVEAVVLLMGLGVRTLSMSASRLPYVKAVVRSLSMTEAEDLVQLALELRSSAEIRSVVRDALEKRGLAEFMK